MLKKQLEQFGQVKTNEPLAKHTTFKIGGPAEYLVIVEDTEKLVELLKWLDGEGIPRFILGGGSNMLANDEGFRGVVVKIKTQTIEAVSDGIMADAGCITVAVAQFSIQHNFTGFEWGVGVPGTIGGAVRGNAGAMGGETKDSVASVTVYRDGEVVEYSNADCKFGYRDSVFKHGEAVVLRVRLKLEPVTTKEGMKKALEYLHYRNKTQPQGFASTGCVFKNHEIKSTECAREAALIAEFPEDRDKIAQFFQSGKIPAGWLVEKAGQKGARVGQAMVSERHGNFVVNAGGATAADVLALVEQIKTAVMTKTGFAIEEEMQVI